jgi:pyrroline-5-carboxylate reductase
MTMRADLKVAFIGSGAMGEAMIQGLLKQGLAEKQNIVAADPLAERGARLHEQYGVASATDNRQAVLGADVIVLAVKPQVLPAVLANLKDKIPPGALVLSIVAGARIEMIANGLAHASIVRSMPNSPAQIGEGITVWIASPNTTAEQRAQAKKLLLALGEEVEAKDEDELDMATALSGTGPAYVFLFMEALVDAGVHLGFSRQVAEQLVTQTVRGSVDFYRSSPSHLARLRNQVTSPGGTSAEALYYLEKAGFRTAISRAVWAAYQRSVTLGQGRKRGSKPEGEK